MTEIFLLCKNIPNGSAVPIIRTFIDPRIAAFPYSMRRHIVGRLLNLLLGQAASNLYNADPLRSPRENHSDDICSFFVHDPFVFVFRIFAIAVAGNRCIPFPGFAACFIRLLLFATHISQIPFVHDIQKRCKLAALLIGAVYIVRNGYETYMILREIDLGIIPGLQVVSPDTGHILDNDGRNLSGFDIGNHPFPSRAIEIATGETVIRIVHTVIKTMLLCIVPKNLLLRLD